MIVSGILPSLYIDLGKDEPGMILQRLDGRVGQSVRGVSEGVVESPVIVISNPGEVYRNLSPPSHIFYCRLASYLAWVVDRQ